MAVVPQPPAIVTGVVTSTELAAIVAVLNFLTKGVLAALRATGTQSIPNNTWTALALDASDVDNAAGHSNVTNNSRYTAVYAGWYRAGGMNSWASNATGVRGVAWYVNGVALAAKGSLEQAITVASNGNWLAAPGQLIFLNVGDYVELFSFQTSGGALATQAAGAAVSISYEGTGA